ncbi:MAG TPA: DUF5658 family protein [Bryobacteraceae bacterium]|nr:DUF5658 family protein [Bryobacteraceae bacterium]
MILFAFIGLQITDTLTTLLFLHHGVPEGNPLIRAALAGPVQPALVLALAKSFAILLATLAWRSGRTSLLRKVNLLFGVLVVWNLAAALVGKLQ